jgi:hypothetical protein
MKSWDRFKRDRMLKKLLIFILYGLTGIGMLIFIILKSHILE